MKMKLLFTLLLVTVCSTAHATCTPSTLQGFANTPGILVTIPAIAGCTTNITDIHATQSNYTSPLAATSNTLAVWPAACTNLTGIPVKYGVHMDTVAALGAKDEFQSPAGLVIKLGSGVAGCIGWFFNTGATVPVTFSYTVSYQ